MLLEARGITGRKRQQLSSFGLNGIQEWPWLFTCPLDDGKAVKVTPGHLSGRQIAIGQVKAPCLTRIYCGTLSRSTPNPFVLHEQDPAILGSVSDPGGVFHVLSLRNAVVLGEGDELEAASSQQLRDLDASQASVQEDQRKPDHGLD